MKTFLFSIAVFVLLSCQSNYPKQLTANYPKAQPSSTATIKVNKLTSIHIVPLGKVSGRVVDDVVKGLTNFYHKEVIVEKSLLLTPDLLSPSKTRYNANAILNKFKSTKNILIITEKDISTFKGIKLPKKFYSAPVKGITMEWGVFGLGLRPGNICVISSFEKRLGKMATYKLLKERLQKVAIHEVGHNLGLDHCIKNSECLMSDANGTNNQVDHEKMIFCDNCKKTIGIL